MIVAAGFFAIATRVDVYNATSPPALAHAVFGAPNVPHPWWLALHIWVRKFYSIIAFSIVGLTAHQALGETARPRTRAAIIVALYSLGIECAQYLVVPQEPIAERMLDIACGALGGWLGVLVVSRHGHRFTRASSRRENLQA